MKRNYAQIVARLIDNFKQTNNSYHFYRQISERKQHPDESADAYAYSLAYLFKGANKSMSEVEKITHFVKGLKSDIRGSVIDKEPKTFEEAVKIAKKKELNWKTNDKMKEDEKERLYNKRIEELENKIQVIEEKKVEDSEKLKESKRKEKEENNSQNKYRRYNDDRRRGDYRRNRGSYRGNYRENNYRRSDRQNENKGSSSKNEKIEIKAWRTVEGVPICKICKKVGHMSNNCWHKKDDEKVNRTVEETQEYRCLLTNAKIGDLETLVICDTGSGISIIGEEVYDAYFREKHECKPAGATFKCATVTGAPMQVVGILELEIELAEEKSRVEFRVLKGVSDIIIGIDCMKKMDINVDMTREELVIRGKKTLPFSIRVSEARRVIAKGNERIPPNSVMRIRVKTEQD
jgi:hypothetical protein